MFSSVRTSISSIWSFDEPVCIWTAFEWVAKWVPLVTLSRNQVSRDRLTIVKTRTGSPKSWVAGWRIILSSDSFRTFSLILAQVMYMYGLAVTKKRKKKEKNWLKDSLIEPWVSCEFGVRPSTFSIWTLLRVATYATEADYPDFKGCCMIASSFSFFIFRSQPSYPPNYQYRNAKFVNCMKIYCVAESRNTIYSGDTPCDGLYREAPPEMGIFFRLQVYEGVGISLNEVYKRLGNLSFGSVKGPKNRWITCRENVLFLWLIPI